MESAPRPKKVLLAPCGTNCAACDRFAAARDPDLAAALAASWEADGRAARAPESFSCRGCRRDGTGCTDPECEIRACSRERGDVVWCAECPDFACDRLVLWAEGDPERELALFRMRGMHADLNGLAAPT